MKAKPFLFFFTLLCLANLACQSKELSRAKAEEMLRASDHFGKTLNKTINLGFWSYGNCGYLESNIRQSYPDAPRDWLTLKEVGLVDFKDSYRPPSGFMAGIRGCEIVLSEKGRSWHLSAQGQNKYKMPLATSEFVSITGIKADEKQTAATVDFNWRWTLTEVGEKLQNLFNDTQAKVGRASLQRYDDGWRVVEAQGVNQITARAPGPFGLFQDESFSVGESLPASSAAAVISPSPVAHETSPVTENKMKPPSDSQAGYESIAGTIGKYPIMLSFREFENGKVTGSYRYKGKSQSLQLEGSVSNARTKPCRVVLG